MDWVRLYHDMPTDPKWRVIAKKAGMRIGDVIAVFTFVLVSASGNTVKRGVTQGLVAEDIAAAIDLDEASVTAILGAMEGKVVKDGMLLGWEKRNPIREDSSTDRVRKHRETVRNAVERNVTLDKTREDKTREEKKEESSLGGSPPAKPSKPKAARRSLPENFPLEPDLEWSRSHWLAKGRADLCALEADEIEKFRDHHTGKGTTSADWSGSWRTWTKNAMRFNHPRNAGAVSGLPQVKILKVV